MSEPARYPIPEETRAAQSRASTPTVSSWASANAGAGKTHVLTTRVARLLLTGTTPDRILCITYTKAAAAEMKARLFDLLGRWSTRADDDLRADLTAIEASPDDLSDLAEARRLFARALETPGGLKIQTIHSFCQLVLSRFPLEAGVSPAFRVLDDREGTALLEDVRAHILDTARTGEDAALSEAVALVAARVDETVFDDMLFEIRTRPAAFTDRDALRERIFAALGVRPGECARDLLLEAFSNAQIAAIDLPGLAAALRDGGKSDLDRAAKITAMVQADDRPATYEHYRSAFLTLKGEPAKRLATKSVAEAHPHVLNALQAEQSRILDIESRRRALLVAEATAAMLIIAERYTALYSTRKEETGALDYDDLIQYTQNLLEQDGSNAWVLFKLDAGIDHVLIDEAQDTSPRQWAIIERLTQEFFAGHSAAEEAGRLRTVFAVGDEKQSIYSFQGAQPAAFGRMRQHFETHSRSVGAAWDPVDLTLSFRSAPEILRAVDHVFARPDSTRMVTVGGSAVHHVPLRAQARGLVEIWPVMTPDIAPDTTPWDAPLDRIGTTSPPAALAGRIAATIADWIASGETLTSTGAAIQPKDILILVRRRNAFVDTLIRKLKERRIPVAGADRLLLTEHIAVMDLMALGQSALLPQDDLTLATVLKSPFFNWSEDDLFALAHRRTGRLWTALHKRADESPLWQKTHDRLLIIQERAGFLTPFEFYAWLLGQDQGFAQLLKRLGPDAADPIEEFLTLAQDLQAQGITSLQGFLHALSHNPPEIKRDMEANSGADDGGEVRIMTVHGAKGLEARIVFLPDTCSKPDSKQDPKLLITPDDVDTDPLVFWPMRKAEDVPPSAAIRETLAERREAEYRRLLYVAMTRAQDRLYICGYQGSRPRPADCWYDLIDQALHDHMEEITDRDGTSISRLGEAGSSAVETEHKPIPAAPAPPDWVHQAAPSEPLPIRTLGPSQIGHRLDEADPTPTLSPLARSPGGRFVRGRLVHKLLETLPLLPPADRDAAADRYLSQPGHGLGPAEAEELRAEVMAIMDDPAFTTLFGPDSRAEVPLSGRIAALGDDIVIDGQVDRLVVSDSQVHIVDYKTNRPAPTDPGAVAPAYLTQMALYRALLGQLFPAHHILCSLVWTDGPHRLTLPDRQLDAAFAALIKKR